MKKLLNIFVFVACMMLLTTTSFAGRKKIMTINIAKLLAERAIVESVYGIKLKFEDSITDIIDAQFSGNTKSKTGRQRISNISFEEIIYDEERDIAKVTAFVRIGSISVLDHNFRSAFKDKVIKRVAFATSTKSERSKLAAMRAAEVDAYKNLLKQITGFTLESETSVENFMLKSDKVKATVLGAIMGAELVEYRWEGKDNDAVVKFQINAEEFKSMLPEGVKNLNSKYIVAEGYGASVSDYETVSTK